MTKTSTVLVAFSTADGAAGRSLISALEEAAIAVEAVVIEEAAGPEASAEEALALAASSLLVAFHGAAQPPPGLGELIDRARLAGVPLIVVRAPGAHLELPSSVEAHATEARESLARRNSELAALHARVTGIVRQFEATLTPADTVVMPERRDTSMRTQSSDQAMLSSYEPRVRPDIVSRPEISLDPATGRVVWLPTEIRTNRSEGERALERERASSRRPAQTGKLSTASAKRSRRTEVPGALDAVHFGVTAPDRLAPADAGIVDVWAFLGNQREQVLKAAREEHHEPVTTVTQGPTRIARGSVLHARLWFEDLDVPDPLSSILWDGEIGKTTFLIKAPPGLKSGPRHGKVTILMAGLPIAHLSCITRLEERAGAIAVRTRTSAFDAARRRTAFASYASHDRREVIARVHGLEKAGVDVFVDVKSLRSGEHYETRLLDEIATRDVFFLFWSKAASRSQWVDKEWRFALSRRGADFIDPVPLVRPDEVPPPKELAETLHFADWTLAYTSARALAPARWWQVWKQ